MSEGAIYGCETCATSAGIAGCPVHRRWTTPSPSLIIADQEQANNRVDTDPLVQMEARAIEAEREAANWKREYDAAMEACGVAQGRAVDAEGERDEVLCTVAELRQINVEPGISLGLAREWKGQLAKAEKLNHQWNVSASRLCPGSEFVDDPERVFDHLGKRLDAATAAIKRHSDMRLTAEHDRAVVLQQLAEAQADRERLDWWEAHLNYEHGTDWDTGDVLMYRVSGNVNDRVWTEMARAGTLRAAIDAARQAEASR